MSPSVGEVSVVRSLVKEVALVGPNDFFLMNTSLYRSPYATELITLVYDTSSPHHALCTELKPS
jgi:hypothetical protein